MNKIGLFAVIIMSQITLTQSIIAGDFNWLDNLNVRAEADSSGYRLRLATRFQIGNLEVNAVLNQVNHAADAYMIFRLGELSHRPYSEVINVYRTNKQKGWGKIAKDLGIKPGSKEFHGLKKGHSLYADEAGKPGKSAGKGNNKNKSKNKGKKGKK